jgi:hypothetical protein
VQQIWPRDGLSQVKVAEWNKRAIPLRLQGADAELKQRMFNAFDVFRKLQLRRYRSHKYWDCFSYKSKFEKRRPHDGGGVGDSTAK